jgi:integrase
MSPIVRHRAAIVEPTAFGQLLRAIEDYPGSLEVRAGLQLLALTFVRPGELRAARWAEIDLNEAIWRVPPERIASGVKLVFNREISFLASANYKHATFHANGPDIGGMSYPNFRELSKPLCRTSR